MISLWLSFAHINIVSASDLVEGDLIETVGRATIVRSNGDVYLIEDGIIYEVMANDEKREMQKLYDPEFLRRSYVRKSGLFYRQLEGAGRFPIRNSFVETLKGAGSVHDIIGPHATFTSMTLMGDASPLVSDYVALRRKILDRQSDFIDSRIDISTKQAHSGEKSLRFSTPKSSIPLNKSSIDTELVFLKRYDEFAIDGWFYIEEGRPTSIIDLESNYMVESPGIRVMLDEALRPRVELKFAYKPVFEMDEDIDYSVPMRQWVHVKLYVYLRDDEGGRVRLWVDGDQKIDGYGRTLTLFDAVYNSLQIGITASPADMDTVLYADDLQFSVRTTGQ